MGSRVCAVDLSLGLPLFLRFRKAAAVPLNGLGHSLFSFLTPPPSCLNLGKLGSGTDAGASHALVVSGLRIRYSCVLDQLPSLPTIRGYHQRRFLATRMLRPTWAHLVQHDIAFLRSGNVDIFMQHIFSYDADLSILGFRVEFVGRTVVAMANQLQAAHFS